MAAFAYAALDGQGREQRGILEADSSRQVRQQLRDRGLAPLRIEAAVKPRGAAERARGRGGPRLAIADLALITRQLGTLIQSGMPVEEALATVSRQSEKAKVRSLVASVRSRVMEGHSLAAGMGDFPSAFPTLYRATVAAGEHAGFLGPVLERLADYSESAHAARQKVRLALLYPVLLFVVAVSIVTGLMIFVVPDVVEVFVGQGQELPLLTRGLIGVSDFVVNYGLLFLLLLVAGVAGVVYALRNEAIALRLHRQFLRWPLIRRVSRATNTARFASTLSILTSSGVPLVEAMQIAGKVLSNKWLQRAVTDATQQVREGMSLHRALEQCQYFPPMMIHMIASGEASGKLDTMLERVADNQQREQEALVATALGVFEPLMLLFMGGAVLLIVVAILLPIFNLTELV